jgi:hypothetical protein
VTRSLQSFAERPPSEVEWEDLLVRLDIVPRAVRLAVEDVGDTPAVRGVLLRAVKREWTVGELYLPHLRSGERVPEFGRVSVDARVTREDREPDALDMAFAFARMRERNFAQLQRRGLGVWEWRSEVEGGEGTVTAYQLMQWMAHEDAETLSALRGTR